MQGRPRRPTSADTAASHLPPHTQLEPGTRLSPAVLSQPPQSQDSRLGVDLRGRCPWAANELEDAREWGLLLFTLPRCWVGREVLSSTLSRSGGSIGFPRYSLWGEHGVRGASACSEDTSGGAPGAAPWGQASRAHLDQVLQTWVWGTGL